MASVCYENAGPRDWVGVPAIYCNILFKDLQPVEKSCLKLAKPVLLSVVCLCVWAVSEGVGDTWWFVIAEPDCS